MSGAAYLASQDGDPIQENNPLPVSNYAREEWTVTGTSGANAAVTLTKALVAGQKHIITGYLVVVRAAAVGTEAGVALKDGTTVKWQDYFGLAQPRGTRVGATGLNIAMTTATATTLVVDAAGTSAITEATMTGYTVTV